MLDLRITPHRPYLQAQCPVPQKLFLLVQVQAQAQIRTCRPPVALVFVVDTSGSMRELVTLPDQTTGRMVEVDGRLYEEAIGGKTKQDLLLAALHGVADLTDLTPKDQFALVRFDDKASVVAPLGIATARDRFHQQVEALKHFSGGTMMGQGLRLALQELNRVTTPTNRRVVLLTDGQTQDEAHCRELVRQFTYQNIAITTVGVGSEYNEDLLADLAAQTQGQPVHVVLGAAQPPSISVSQLPQWFAQQWQAMSQEVITGLTLQVRTVRDVTLDRITRVYPFQAEVDPALSPVPLGNLDAHEPSLFVLEFSLPTRSVMRVRLAQLSFSYTVPGLDQTGTTEVQDVVVEFSDDPAVTGQIDTEVMGYVQQRNLDALVQQATQQARHNPQQAAHTLTLARQMTQRLGNTTLTLALDRAALELKQTGTLSPDTTKTVRIGVKTQTLKLGSSGANLPAEAEIRRLTGA
ncbi:VWA domain-containing protein [Candidatus Cyanaurora vandensis]|uniref:vWA domain-containing protein n=1 Tax=Candidatus Cyanaurora vandensis TaxID=2714958 RepID=UPI00257F923E|nr:VWA domain-containing protein [Candidatus Cyanaurora vandensis]